MWPGDEASTAPVLITGNVNAWHLDKIVYDVLTTNYCLFFRNINRYDFLEVPTQSNLWYHPYVVELLQFQLVNEV